MAFKTCSCGREYTETEWTALEFVGIHETSDELRLYHLELRNCRECHSTIGVETSEPLADSSTAC